MVVVCTAEPSPKFQKYVVIVVPACPGALAEPSKLTVSGELPLDGVVVKLAVGGIST